MSPILPISLDTWSTCLMYNRPIFPVAGVGDVSGEGAGLSNQELLIKESAAQGGGLIAAFPEGADRKSWARGGRCLEVSR